MQKRPNDSNETRFYLEEHGSGLWVTICHIRCEIGLNRSSHFAHWRGFRVVDCCYHCQNSHWASLPMHCFHCILTSLISQALLQAALDKEPSVFHGWLLLREFLKLPGITSGRIDQRKVHHDQQTKIKLPSLAIHSRSCQRSWLFF
jgi:hypothetical protein